jgi:2-succinyl-5-enolpyruvyl-6-hydroxy-3-cyclohexene-1-carboxylate synthase
MVVGGFDAIWGAMSAVEAWCPDFVLQLGASPISRGWEQLNAVTPVPRIVVHPWAWADPSSSAEALVQSDVPRLVDALQRRQYERHRRDADFADRFLRAERTIWDAAQSIVQGAGEALTEAVVGRLVVGGAPERSALYLGNSLPIRNVDRWVPPCDKELRVFCQRGVSGIDGVVSGAAGVGSCEHHATTLLIGDVSFLHDLNGLELASRASTPLVVVVINNGGGRIFEQLPIARQGAESWLPFFTTPHDASLASAASVYGCRFQQATEVGELRRAIHAAHAHRGCTIIEAIVPARSALEQEALLAARVEEALG